MQIFHGALCSHTAAPIQRAAANNLRNADPRAGLKDFSFSGKIFVLYLKLMLKIKCLF